MPRGIPGSGPEGGKKRGGSFKPQGFGAKLVKILNSATPESLASIDEELVEARGRVIALESARELVANEVLNRPIGYSKPEPPKALAIGSKEELEEDELLAKVCRYLIFSGPKGPNVIRKEFKLTEERFKEIIDCDFFEKVGPNYGVTTEGRLEYDPKNEIRDR